MHPLSNKVRRCTAFLAFLALLNCQPSRLQSSEPLTSGGSVTGGNTGDTFMIFVGGSQWRAYTILRRMVSPSDPWSPEGKIFAAREALAMLVASNRVSWTSSEEQDGPCLQVIEAMRPKFALKADFRHCSKVSSVAEATEKVLELLLVFHGLPQNDATLHAQKLVSDDMHRRELGGRKPEPWTGITMKAQINFGRELAIKAMNFESIQDAIGPFSSTLSNNSDGALFLQVNRDKIINVLHDSRITVNSDIRQIASCASSELVDGFPFIHFSSNHCNQFTEPADIGELMLHESLHLVGIADEADAIQLSRLVFGPT